MRFLVFFSLIICWSVSGVLAQPRLKMEKTRHDFGTVPESEGQVSYTFRFQSTGTAPVIITDVRSSCDCTVPDWPQEPVIPGETGEIEVVFITTGSPGVFDKTITVYTNTADRAVNLRITGNVERTNIPPRPEFTQNMGSLRLNARFISLGEISHRRVVTASISTFNPGGTPVRISFADVPAHMEVLASPEVLQAGNQGQIRLVYDASARRSWGYTTDRFSVVVNGSDDEAWNILVSADIAEDFSQLTSQQRQSAPRMIFVRSSMMLGEISVGERRSFSVAVRNIGKSPLFIRRVETGCSCMEVVSAPEVIPAGGTAEIVCAYVGELPSGGQQRILSVRTNDPEKPVQTLRIQATVVE